MTDKINNQGRLLASLTPRHSNHSHHTHGDLSTTNGNKGIIAYHANWTNQQNVTLLSETTRLEFSAAGNSRIIDRITTLTASIDVNFNDVKDGMLGMRLAHELQIPTDKDQKFTDNKGNVTHDIAPQIFF